MGRGPALFDFLFPRVHQKTDGECQLYTLSLTLESPPLYDHLVVQDGFQAFAMPLCTGSKLVSVNPFIQVGNLLWGGNAHPLILLYHGNEIGRPVQGINRSRIYPGIAAAEQLGRQSSFPEIELVQVGDLQFPSDAGPDQIRFFADSRRVEVQAHHGIIGFRVFRFLLNTDDPKLPVFIGYLFGLHDAEALRILDVEHNSQY